MTTEENLNELLDQTRAQLVAVQQEACELRERLDGSKYASYLPREIPVREGLPLPRIELLFEEGGPFSYQATLLLVLPTWGSESIGHVLGWSKRSGGPMWRAPGVLDEPNIETDAILAGERLGLPVYRIAEHFVQPLVGNPDTAHRRYHERRQAAAALAPLGSVIENRVPDMTALDRIATILDTLPAPVCACKQVAEEVRNTGRPIGELYK